MARLAGRRVVIDGETFLLVDRYDLRPATEERARRDIVQACLDEPAGRSRARRLVEELTGGIMLGRSDIARELDRLLARGQVIAVRERGTVRQLDAPALHDPARGRGRPGADDPQDPGRPRPGRPDVPAGPDEPDEPVVKTTWIEVHLVDDADQPVAGERVAIRFPDGSETQSYLDADGRYRLDGIPTGTYQVCFPDADGAWRAIGRDGA